MVTRRQVLGLVSGLFVRPSIDAAEERMTATLTGDLLTDAVREAGTQSDGLTTDSSVGIYPERTSWLPNGGFEHDTRYWNAAFGAVTRQQTNVLPGKAHGGRGTITSSGQTAYIQVQGFSPVQPAAPERVTFAAFVYPSAALIGQVVTVYMLEYGGASASAVLGNATRSFTLVDGQNLVYCTATPTQADRTGAYGRLVLIGFDAGVYLNIAGADIWSAGFPYPHADTNEVRAEYDPVTNLLSNGEFETNITGWTAVNATRTQSTEQAKAGTGSLKGVVTTAGQAWAQASYAASPVPVDSYACGGWIYGTPEIVGKAASVNLNESGGAQPAATVGSDARPLDAGWNYFLAHGTVQQTDRTSLVVLPFLNGAAINDRFYYDSFRLGGGYVAPDPTLVTFAAGRIQLDAGPMHADRFVRAICLEPDWSTAAETQPGRPTMPVTLWQRTKDASNKITLTFDGGLLTLTRTSPAGSDVASTPWAPERGSATVIVCSGTPDGVFVSVDGRSLVGPIEAFVTDTFTRADTASGLGTTETGGKTWLTTGASAPKITSNRYTPHASTNGTGYAYLNLGEKPARIAGVASYVDGGGGGSLNHTIACDSAAMDLNNLMHLFLNRTSANYQWRDAGGIFNNYRGSVFGSTIPLDGTGVPVEVTIHGDTLAIKMGNETFAFRHESVARLHSQYVFWEVGRANGVSGTSSRWDSIAVSRFGEWSGPSANIPIMGSDLEDVGSAGDGSGHLCGKVRWFVAGDGRIGNRGIAQLAAFDDTAMRIEALPSSMKPTRFWTADDASVTARRPTTYLGSSAVRRG